MPPTHPSLLLWAHVILLWMLAHYLILDQRSLASRPEDARSSFFPRAALRHTLLSLGAAIATAVLALDWRIFAAFMIASIVMVVARTARPEWRVWERELLVTILFAMTTAVIVDGASLVLRNAVLVLPLSADRINVMCVVTALFLYTIHGGTYIVRGILRSSGVPGDSARVPDAIELRRGLWIGALERAILFCVVIAGSYEALGFVVAAKGLIRSRDLEASRDLTEYFLIGSLASVAVALATGIAARYIIQALW